MGEIGILLNFFSLNSPVLQVCTYSFGSSVVKLQKDTPEREEEIKKQKRIYCLVFLGDKKVYDWKNG